MKHYSGLVGILALASCTQMCPDNPVVPEQSVDEGIFAQRMGDAMTKATSAQLETFEKGREVALRRFDTDSGLGPHFNVTFCGACHERPTLGGSAPRYRDFLLVSTLLDDGSSIAGGTNGVQTHYSTVAPQRVETDPSVNHVATRNSVPFFGSGAIAAISEESILANADEDDADGDGISGRPNYDRGFVGRFGRKAQTVSIEGFIRGPLFNHLGITSVPLSNELKAKLPIPSVADQQELSERNSPLPCINCQAAAPSEPTVDDDGVPDPELSEQALFDLVSFAMLLGAPQPDEPTAASLRGEKIFADIQCSACHVPTLSGPDGAVPLYSDLLLHDMGDELADGVQMGVATGREFRTQPLWGVIATQPYLHDGRASTLDEAIMLHGGEGTASRDAYIELDATQRADLHAFLESLGGSAQRSAGLLPPDAPIADVGEWGGPQVELAGAEATRFASGREVFDRDFDKRDGLGLGLGFNGDSCRACHFDPVIGGAGPAGVNVTRQGIVDTDTMSYSDPMAGTMVHHHSTDRSRPPVDPLCNVIELRQTPAMFGLGLIEKIADETILSRHDPDDADADGISGRAHVRTDGRVGRFGWKAGIPSVEDFVRDALSNELGLTLTDRAEFIAGIAGDDDEVADPEFEGTDYDALVFWSKLLGAPPRAEIDDAARAGEALFEQVGCASCHTPRMETTDGEEVALYSDLLLHDVAPEGYLGIADGEATMREFRTPPLWGIRATAPYMHDGLAPTLEAAILRHFSEGSASRESFEQLSEAQRADLLAFLESL